MCLNRTAVDDCQMWFDTVAARYHPMGITIQRTAAGFVAQHHRPAATPVMLGLWSNKRRSGWVFDEVPDMALRREMGVA